MISNQPKKSNPPNLYFKYMGVGLQMAATIIVMALIGRWLDTHFQSERPLLTLLFLLLGTVFSILSLIRQLKSS